MTDQTTKPTQKRLYSCGLGRHKSAKTHEKSDKTRAEISKAVILQPTPPSELKTSAKTRKLGATQSYLGNIG